MKKDFYKLFLIIPRKPKISIFLYRLQKCKNICEELSVSPLVNLESKNRRNIALTCIKYILFTPLVAGF